MSNAILEAREQRNWYIVTLAKKSQLITVKANVPGGDKRVKESFLLVRYFVNRLTDQLSNEVLLLDNADGMCAILPASGENIKLKTTELEDTTPIGRFADLDVYLKGAKHSLSRGHMRKCYLCDNDAFVCAKLGTHTTQQLLVAFKEGVRNYFSQLICSVIKESLQTELNLEDKFGLVTPTSNGSHGDLNYEIMTISQEVIAPYLTQMFWVGFDSEDVDNLLDKLRPIGIEAENAMYKAVATNTYKGFIFVAGVLLASFGHLLSTGGGKYLEIFDIVERICKGVTDELYGEGSTFGIEAYRLYGFTGVRGHAEQGFYAVRKAEKIVDAGYSPKSLLKALTYIVGDIEDTVLLKRSGSLQKYTYYKNAISSIDVDDKSQLKLLNAECIKNGISIGGSADVLASAVMLKKLRQLWYLEK